MNDEWTAIKQKFPFGAEVTGTVVRVETFGIFISIEGAPPGGGFADVAGMHHGGADGSLVLWPAVGDPVAGVVVDQTDRNQQIKLHLR
jgi:ribosomal protein S1